MATNLYSNKVTLLRQAVKQLTGVVSLLERVADLENLQGDKKYADEVYGHFASALEELQYDIGMELEAVQAMVDLGNVAPTDDTDAPQVKKGDHVVYINDKSIEGFVSDTYEKDGELYAYVDTGEAEIPLIVSSLRKA
jgi:hypothetical protein